MNGKETIEGITYAFRSKFSDRYPLTTSLSRHVLSEIERRVTHSPKEATYIYVTLL